MIRNRTIANPIHVMCAPGLLGFPRRHLWALGPNQGPLTLLVLLVLSTLEKNHFPPPFVHPHSPSLDLSLKSPSPFSLPAILLLCFASFPSLPLSAIVNCDV